VGSDRGRILASRLARWQAGRTMPLNDRDIQILDFEQSWWTRPEKKGVAIRTASGSRRPVLPASR